MIVETIVVLLGVSLTAIVAVSFWRHILSWANSTFFPWLERHLPTIAPHVRHAFAWFDKNIAVPVRNAIRQAWKKLRQSLLKATIKFERYSSSQWVKRWTAYLIVSLQDKKVVKQEVTEETAWEDIPDDVRAAFLRKGISDQEVNVTQARDMEIEEMSF